MRKQRGFVTCFICKKQVRISDTVSCIRGHGPDALGNIENVCKIHPGVELVEIKEPDTDLTNSDS